MKKTMKEFKEFIAKGNVIDMAVGVIIGGAFGKIVTSLVNDILMPLLGLLTGGADFSTKKIVLSPAVIEGGEVVKAEGAILYGAFIQNIIDFLLIAICIFFFIKAINKMKDKLAKKEEEKPEEKKPTQEELLTEIRDLLKEKN